MMSKKWAVFWAVTFFVPISLAQNLTFRADNLVIPEGQLSGVKCVQVGLYVTFTGPKNESSNWAQINATLDYTDPGSYIQGMPFVKNTNFATVTSGGIANPGEVIENNENQMTSCITANIVNAATLGSGPAIGLATGSEPSSLLIENLNAGTGRIQTGALHFSTSNITLESGVEYLFAIVEFPVSAASQRNSFSGANEIRINFTQDNVVPDGNIVSDGINSLTAATQDGSIVFGGQAIAADRIGLFRTSNNFFYLDVDGNARIESGGEDRVAVMGANGDIPFVGDWNGDGVDELGLRRTGVYSRFFLDTNGDDRITAADRQFFMGATTDIALKGDWNGDGTDEVGLFRPSNNQFFLDMNNDGAITGADVSFLMGASGDLPIVGDWNGDGTDEVGLFRPSRGLFYLDTNNSRSITLADAIFFFGSSVSVPLVGDWNGDGVDEVGIMNPDPSVPPIYNLFYLDANNDRAINAGDIIFGMGIFGDIPIVGKW